MKKINLICTSIILLFTSITINAIDEKPIDEKPMVIVITSFNNKAWYIRNLDSVFSQQYTNYRIIYLDDCSEDGTGYLVENYIKQKGQDNRVTLIKNTHRKRALANHYRAIHMCKDDEIILHLDGDDWFTHNMVLSLINETYNDPNIWITYGQYKFWPSGQIGLSKPVSVEFVNKNQWRDVSNGKFWTPGQLRTFYAWLGKLVKLEDCIFDGPDFTEHVGLFYPSNCDALLFITMMEMAGHHHKFISDVIYAYNIGGAHNNFKVASALQLYGGKLIRSKGKNQNLSAPIIDRISTFSNSFADIILFIQSAISQASILLLPISKALDSSIASTQSPKLFQPMTA